MKGQACNLDDFPLSRNKDSQALKFWFCTQILEFIFYLLTQLTVH